MRLPPIHMDMIETAKVENPLLARIRLPGETHSLPSRGLFYTDGELDPSIKDGEVHIHPMTTIDEITMRSADLLFTGKAIEEIFKRCIPSVLKPHRLFQKDVDFLLTVLRKVTYGDEVEITYQHNCASDAKIHSYNVNLPNILRHVKKINPTTIGSKFTVRMPNDQVVSVAPLRYDTMIEMLQLTDKDLSLQDREDMAVKLLLNVIEKVDSVTEKSLIKEWLKQISAGWSRKIDEAIKSTQDDWGVDFNVIIQCLDCQQQVKVPAPLNPLFFFI